MQLAGVEVVQELLQSAGLVDFREVAEEIHMPEAVDGDERQIFLLHAEMTERMGEARAVGRKEVYST